MKIFFLFTALLLSVTGQQCQDADLSAQLHKKWVHSYEDDTDEVEAYRPSGYDFPPARGRRGMEFKADGTFIRYDIAPSDGSLPVPGTWEPVKGKKAVQIKVQGERPETYRLEIVALGDSLLRVKRATVP
jgi:hypothetical protein